MENLFNAAVHETYLVVERCGTVWADPDEMREAVSYFFAKGTQCILGGSYKDARTYASLACYLGQCTAVFPSRLDWGRAIELISTNVPMLLHFYRESIPCSCLDEKYKEFDSDIEEAETEEQAVESVWNYPVILQQEVEEFAAEQEEQEIVESTFEADQLSYDALPDSYVPNIGKQTMNVVIKTLHRFL